MTSDKSNESEKQPKKKRIAIYFYEMQRNIENGKRISKEILENHFPFLRFIRILLIFIDKKENMLNLYMETEKKNESLLQEQCA